MVKFKAFTVLIVVISVFKPGIQEDEAEVEKYKSIINEGIFESSQYQIPKNNNELFENLDRSKESQFFGEFDFIVVGAGSSGSVLSNRLSENPDWNILLLEAGGEETDFSDIPSMTQYLQQSPMNWGYNTTPQLSSCLGMLDEECPFARGKVLGGCSTINAMMYVRGNEDDFDEWERLGNPGWSYADVLPYFKKSELSLLDPSEGTVDEYYHNREGMWADEFMEPLPSLMSNFLGANEELGLKEVDYNGQEQIGFSRLQLSHKNGRRASGGRAFIDPIRRQRNNFKVLTHAFVTNLKINDNKEVEGVFFVHDGINFYADVTKEVILSAGSINTPQILMLSGIGPKIHLRELGIPVVANLPVGKNLQDHVHFFGLNFRTNYTYGHESMNQSIKDYLNGRGIYTYGQNTHGIGFVNTENPWSTVPNIEYIFIPPPSSFTTSFAQFQYNANNETVTDFLDKINKFTDFRVLILLLHPKSRGTVQLQSNDPADFPLIDPNYFSDRKNEDVETMYQGIRHVLKLVKTTSFQQVDTYLQTSYPLCGRLRTKTFWYCLIRHLSTSLYHPIGTTRMGRSPRNSVVNSKLQVHGVKNLRIADCGVFPKSTSGHTSAPAFMVGEKLADIIKDAYDTIFY